MVRVVEEKRRVILWDIDWEVNSLTPKQLNMQDSETLIDLSEIL